MAWRRPGDKPLSEPMMVSLLTHICVTRPQWVNIFKLKQNGRYFPDYILRALSCKKVWIYNHSDFIGFCSLWISWQEKSALVPVLTWRRTSTKPFPRQWWPGSLTHICVIDEWILSSGTHPTSLVCVCVFSVIGKIPLLFCGIFSHTVWRCCIALAHMNALYRYEVDYVAITCFILLHDARWFMSSDNAQRFCCPCLINNETDAIISRKTTIITCLVTVIGSKWTKRSCYFEQQYTRST